MTSLLQTNKLSRLRHTNTFLFRRRHQLLFSSTPRFRVPAHVAAFSLLLTPVAIMTWYAQRFGPKNVEEQVRQRYAEDVAANSTKNSAAAMKVFLQNAMDENASQQQQQIQDVLWGGKGDQKRLHAIDRDLYGTSQGVVTKERTLDALKEEKMARKKRRKQKENQDIVAASGETVKETKRSSILESVPVRQAAAVTAVAGIAAAIGFILGGHRRS